MKRVFTALLALVLAMTLALPAFAAKEPEFAGLTLPKPETPDYFVYYPGEGEEGSDALSMLATVHESVAELAQEYWQDSEGFCEKHGLASFQIALQYDVSLDSEDDWQHTTQWDQKANIGGNGKGYTHVRLDGDRMETVELFWLTYHAGKNTATFEAFQDAIIGEMHTDGEYQWDTYYFDHENHSLFIRCRYIIVWQMNEDGNAGEICSNIGPWSDCAVFGKGSTQVLPNAPKDYAPPVISGLQVHPVDDETETSCLTYTQETPEALWTAEIYYSMVGEGGFTGLETQVSVNGGEWQTVSTDSSAGSQCLKNGLRTVTGTEELVFDKTQNIKLRVRFLGTDGPSEWSNELSVEAEAQSQDVTPEPQVDNRSGAVWIWIAVAAVLAVAVVVVIVLKKRKK